MLVPTTPDRSYATFYDPLFMPWIFFKVYIANDKGFGKLTANLAA